MSTPRLPGVLAAITCLAAQTLMAQPLCDRTNAIETTVINADLVFLATIVEVRPRNRDDPASGSHVDITIEETLKGERLDDDEPYTGLQIDLPDRESVARDWQERTARLLVAVDTGMADNTEVIELNPETLEVMTADIKLLRRPADVIQAARAAVHRLPATIKRVHTFEVIVPRDVVETTRWTRSYRTGGHLTVSVPADEHLERWAKSEILSNRSRQRCEAIRALGYFPSETSQNLIRPFLSDPESMFHTNDGRTGERYYPARHAAYETFKRWGIRVERPIYREPVP